MAYSWNNDLLPDGLCDDMIGDLLKVNDCLEFFKQVKSKLHGPLCKFLDTIQACLVNCIVALVAIFFCSYRQPTPSSKCLGMFPNPLVRHCKY